MVIYDPISQGTGIVQKDSTGQVTVISYPPPGTGDPVAQISQAVDSVSTRSFMQSQWRAVAENMLGMGAIINSYG